MLLSGHCCITNPKSYNYPFIESIKSYLDLCDEIIVVNGACDPITGETKDDGSVAMIEAIEVPEGKSIRVINYYWPEVWTWDEFGRHLDTGYQACSGDFAIKFDADYLFHEKSINNVRDYLSNIDKYPYAPKGFLIRKFNIITGKTYFPKAIMPMIVNKRDYPNLAYGLAYNVDPDFCTAIDVEGETHGLKYGHTIANQSNFLREIRAEVWCYDFTFMNITTIEQVRASSYVAQNLFENLNAKEDDILNWRRAALGKFRKFIVGRVTDRQLTKIERLEDHPQYIRDKVSSIDNNMFGHNIFNWCEGIDLNNLD